MSVGEETLARFLSGDVSIIFGETEWWNKFGEGRDEVGLILLIADENCVCPKS